MPARRRTVPWILGVIVLVLAALATHAPIVCRDAGSGTDALSEVSVTVPAVSVAPHDPADPCGDAGARLDVSAARITATDLVPTRVVAAAAAARGDKPAGDPVRTVIAVMASSRPPVGLAIADLAVARI